MYIGDIYIYIYIYLDTGDGDRHDRRAVERADAGQAADGLDQLSDRALAAVICICVCNMYVYIYIYIQMYIERERCIERDI